MKKLNYIILSLLMCGCQMETQMQTDESPIVRTKVTDLQFSQSGKINLESLGIVGAYKIIKKDQLYVILTPQSSHRICIYNSATGEVTRLIPAGTAEGEGLYYLSMTLNGTTVSTFDVGTGKLAEIDLTQYALPGYQPVFTSLKAGNKTPSGALRLGERLISTGIYTQGRYCSTSQATGSDTYSVSYPACADPTLTDTLKSVLFANNYLMLKPSLTRLACANIENGCLDICEIQEDKLVRVNEVHLTNPRVAFNRTRPQGRGMVHPVTYRKDNALGFCDLTVSDQYIFALYSGRTYKQHKNNIDKGQTIIVFDWNGSHVRTYHLDRPCSSISYDADENVIYALANEKGKREIIQLNL